MNYLSVESLSKSYGDKLLFREISFGMNKGQKTALIAANGTGKSTLLRILSGQDSPDQGKVAFREGIKRVFLPQEPVFEDQLTVGEVVLHSDHPVLQTIREYELCMERPADEKKMQEILNRMDQLKAWDYEARIKQILSRFKIGDLQKPVAVLSGGQKKRLAMAQLLIDEPEFLMLDEPTNHLDLDMIEWLEEYLSQLQITLLMVTHDRYFLERICNDMLELGQGNLYRYNGNYTYFLEKKAERELVAQKEIEKANNLMRKELDWIRRQPKARGTKAKYRIEAFEELKKTASKKQKEKKLHLELEMSRLGGKILEVEHLSKSFGDQIILQDFNYIFKKGEKIGVAGNNGTGKSTFLNILTGLMPPDSGIIDKGDTIVMGYYSQEGIQLPEDKRVIEVIQEIAEYLPLSKGNHLSASQLLERFLFPPKMQYAFVSTLSGGEKRRLYLLTILMKNPNFLILDEPTNDLDLPTLQVLETFLEDFPGCLLIVTHDRYFMDKIADHIFVFEGMGVIRDFNGSYSEYRARKEAEEEEKNTKSEQKQKIQEEKPQKEKKKLSFKEQKEYEELEREIDELEQKKEKLIEEMNSGALDHQSLTSKGRELEELILAIDAKTGRWLELADYV